MLPFSMVLRGEQNTVKNENSEKKLYFKGPKHKWLN